MLLTLAGSGTASSAEAPASGRLHAPNLMAHAQAARADLDLVRGAQPAGWGRAYFMAIWTYKHAMYALGEDILAEISASPQVIAVDQAFEGARIRLDAATASPATSALELADLQEKAALAKAERDELVRREEDMVLAELGLPRFDSAQLLAAGQSTFIDPDPITGAHGPETEYYPEAPWQVELQWAGFEGHQPPYSPEELHACGGALIAPDWVLTAAHCVWDRKTGAALPASALQARGGAKALADLSPATPISQVHVHPDYQVSTATAPARADIALLHLVRAMPVTGPGRLSAIPYARADFRPPTIREAVTASGWGATEDFSYQDQVNRISAHGRLKMSPLLRIVPQRVFDQNECAEEIRDRVHAADKTPPPPEPVHPGNLCAGGVSGTCQGDSGGPLVAHANMHAIRRRGGEEPVLRGRDHPVVFGVVSWGAGCRYFTVFTRVSAYSAWIDQVLATGGR